jgi:hypothetical protein
MDIICFLLRVSCGLWLKFHVLQQLTGHTLFLFGSHFTILSLNSSSTHSCFPSMPSYIEADLSSTLLMVNMMMQVLDFGAFSEPEYDLPIFCANAFTSPARSIVVL